VLWGADCRRGEEEQSKEIVGGRTDESDLLVQPGTSSYSQCRPPSTVNQLLVPGLRSSLSHDGELKGEGPAANGFSLFSASKLLIPLLLPVPVKEGR